MLTSESLEKSILVAAHPDDEVLWFSSILDKVGEVVFCYINVKSHPQWTNGRKQSLSRYPIENIKSLGLDESEVFSDDNFLSPVIGKYGIEVSKQGIAYKTYIDNYYELKKILRKNLIDCKNVITHNPWGEYGNEEHIQVYNVIKELQEKLKFTIWFSNYCSNKSFPLMTQYVSEFDSEYMTLKTNKRLSNKIKDLYKKNGCWTWYDDWKCFDEESLIKDDTSKKNIKRYGRCFPLNLIKVNAQVQSKKEASFINEFIGKLSAIRHPFRTFTPGSNYLKE